MTTGRRNPGPACLRVEAVNQESATATLLQTIVQETDFDHDSRTTVHLRIPE